MNRVTLIGRIGQVEDKSTNGISIVKVSVATSETFKDKDGNKQTETEWHNCTAFGKTADVINQHFKKGDGIAIEGKIKSRTWEADGVKKYATDIIIQGFYFLPTKKHDGEQAQNYTAPEHPPVQTDDLPF